MEWSGLLPPIMVPRSSKPVLQSEAYSQGATYSKHLTINTDYQEGNPFADMDSASWPVTVPKPSSSDKPLPDLGKDVLDDLNDSAVQYFEPGAWCSIKHFELNRLVGEVRTYRWEH